MILSKMFYFFIQNKYKNNWVLPCQWIFLIPQISDSNFALNIPTLHRDIQTSVYPI